MPCVIVDVPAQLEMCWQWQRGMGGGGRGVSPWRKRASHRRNRIEVNTSQSAKRQTKGNQSLYSMYFQHIGRHMCAHTHTHTHTHTCTHEAGIMNLSGSGGRPGGGIREYLHAFVDFFHMIYDPNCRCTHQRHIITHKHTHTTAVACVCAYVCERLGSAQKYATLFVLRVNKKAWQTAQLLHLATH